jgi:hypothetical protein
MFQFPRCPPLDLYIQTRGARGSLWRVSPFGDLRVNRLFTANRSLSQCPTSFVGTWRQGIHRKLLVASPRDAENLILFGLHQKDQSLFGCQGSISPLTGERCVPHSSSTPLDCQLISFDKATQLIAGSHHVPKRFERYC